MRYKRKRYCDLKIILDHDQFESKMLNNTNREGAQQLAHSKVPNLLTTSHQPNSFYSSTLAFIIIFITITVNSINLIQCSLSILDTIHPQECELDRNSKHVVIEPMVVVVLESNGGNATTRQNTQKSVPLTANITCTDSMRISFSNFDGQTFVIDLVKNKRLISDRYFRNYKDKSNVNRHDRHPDASATANSTRAPSDETDTNSMFLDLHKFTSNDQHCHYHGLVNDNLNSISAISIVEHELLSGFFHDGNDIYYLHANTTTLQTVLTKPNDLCSSKQEAINETTKISDNNGKKSTRTKRSSLFDNPVKHEPFMSNSSSLYVELLVVHDHTQYIGYKGNRTLIVERTMQIVNIMNAFYRQLNIFIVLVGVVVWVEKDEIQLIEDGDATLTNFLKYRYEKLLPKYHHDNAQLITSTSFNGSVVGKALKGPICTHEHSGGVNTDHSQSPAIVAVTLAHELGHNFGMEHDEEENCRCPDEKCIMSSSSSAVHPKYWSSCSIEYLEEAKSHGLLDCLADMPEKVFGPICGNGFVEEGEDCDLGEPVPTYGTSKSRKSNSKRGSIQTVNQCCDRQSCKFIGNATCAQGPCCDLAKCSPYNATDVKVCRERQGECDLEEICDGQSEYCPPDAHYHNGIECNPTINSPDGKQLVMDPDSGNRSRAYCFNGKCASHESQCQLLWGPSGSVSKEICYEQNVHGNTSGNCGYQRREKFYTSCEPDDSVCGMLHCVHNQPNQADSRKTGKLNHGFESASILTVSFFVMSNHAKIYCNGAIIDAGPGVRDPGLVPNGAACGPDRMCMNQKCVPISEVIYKDWCPNDCNGNGICDNKGVCHCFDGTIGTSCYLFFGGGFHLSVLLYIIMFFVPLIALMVLAINHYRKEIKIWWFLHNRKIALREKGRDPNHQHRRMTYKIDKNKITISEPIPLNQHSSTNRPFYEPSSMLNLWDETGCEPSKSPGFRLEPLNKQPDHNVVVAFESNNSSLATTSTLRPVRAAPPVPRNEPQS